MRIRNESTGLWIGIGMRTGPQALQCKPAYSGWGIGLGIAMLSGPQALQCEQGTGAPFAVGLELQCDQTLFHWNVNRGQAHRYR